MVGYFFEIERANRGCTFGIDINAFNLCSQQNRKHNQLSLAYKINEGMKIYCLSKLKVHKGMIRPPE